MAPPHGEAIVSSYTFSKVPKLSAHNLHRTVSDISFELSKDDIGDLTQNFQSLQPITEVEDAKCGCCGMSEECTPEYIKKVSDKFSGKWICGLCAEAVKEEIEKNGGKKEEALSTHMSACSRFNTFGRAYPVLFQAEAMREMLKKSARLDGRGSARAKSISPKIDKTGQKAGGIMRTSSCIPAITREMNDLRMSD